MKAKITYNIHPTSEKVCAVSRCMRVIGGKWKIIIIYALRKGVNRFGILQKSIPNISKQMLTTQLRELEKDKIITRQIFPEIPPRVEYAITPVGGNTLPNYGCYGYLGKNSVVYSIKNKIIVIQFF